MTNRERYKQAFSALHPSGRLSLEVEEMAHIQKKHKTNMAIAAAIACAVIIGIPGTVYAADIGGIQEKLSMWLYGEKAQVDVTENGGGGYTFTYEHDGETEQISGGGIIIGEDGTETWMDAGDVAEGMNQHASIEEDNEGRVWVYYYDQKSDITELFDENNLCLISLSHDGETVYLEITRDEYDSYPFRQSGDPEYDRELYTFVPAD